MMEWHVCFLMGTVMGLLPGNTFLILELELILIVEIINNLGKLCVG